METDDLFLHYRFTDRGGRQVFDAYRAGDDKRRQHKLFEIRISVDSLGVPDAEVTGLGADRCYRNHATIVCRCPACQPGGAG